MTKYTVIGPTEVRDCGTDVVVTDEAVLRPFDGVEGDLSGDTFALYSESEALRAKELAGGDLVTRFRDGQVVVTTTYKTSEPLTEAEEVELVKETVAQWADGIGQSDDIISGLPYAAHGEGGPDLVLGVWVAGVLTYQLEIDDGPAKSVEIGFDD